MISFNPSLLSPPVDQSCFFSLLANKIDSESRVVSEKQAKEWCGSKGNLPLIQTSAKNASNVEEAFLLVTRLALQRRGNDEVYFSSSPTFFPLRLISLRPSGFPPLFFLFQPRGSVLIHLMFKNN
eukprot:TRINITY_DN3800_c0_g1_i5.p1 TRINITY_DN3800_c0_g1~~TRINITY_DN3800_c0_g1_i5.p1  ORF type:complete len:125 (+),score=22.18 TRINITY_DN3800_c0_g1_i5:719-1093(+)